MNASIGELESIDGVGPLVAKEVVGFWSQEVNVATVNNCLNRGVIIERKEVLKDQLLANKTFVFTGTLNAISRKDGKDIISQYGGSSTNSISKKTDFLVAGSGAGSKLNKAKNLNVKILSEEQFLKIVKIKPKN